MTFPDISIQISASAVAWYGILLATLSFAISFLNYWRERISLKVKVSYGIVAPTPGFSHGQIQISLEAINLSRHPVTIQMAGFALKTGESILNPHPFHFQFPYELKEGKSVTVYFDKEKLLEEVQRKNTKIIYGWYRIATGKVYKARFSFK